MANDILCPSSACLEGSGLLGIVMPDGKVAISSTLIIINNDFVDAAMQGRDPGERFRFTNSCVQSACKQWSGLHCGVIDRKLSETPESSQHNPLPDCPIRERCRWYLQSNDAACHVCTSVIYAAESSEQR